MGSSYPSVIPCFGLHPWFIEDREPNWFNILKEFLYATPHAAIGEIGLDKGSHGKKIDFEDQVEVFRKQLELSKEFNRPASIHCVRAFGHLLGIMKSISPFPSGVILHSYLGSAEMVPEFAMLGAYFSFSGFLMSIKKHRAKQILRAVPADRILLETDAPDAYPKSNLDSLVVNDRVCSSSSDDPFLLGTLNHPANIHLVLDYVASLLELKREQVAEMSYRNALRVFSFKGSKVHHWNSEGHA